MPIIRNPFRKNDENARPSLAVDGAEKPPGSSNGASQVDLSEKRPVEYKLSEINDSGVYLPPSPTNEKKSFWGAASSRSTTSSSLHRCAFDENEPFSISRESFDSYRRSFDISARSPVIPTLEGRPRGSLDSRTFHPPPRSSNSFHRPLQVPQTQEEDRFEDVNIDDPKPQPQKKRGIFARILDNDDEPRPASSGDKSGPWHHLTGRKRGQSGQGAELGAVPKREATPRPERQVEKQSEKQVEKLTESSQQANGNSTQAPKKENTQAPEIRVSDS
ncbi:Hypothetical predicted protein [Lecanosticta acicola]|uniref:Uncharacterized protein n=1 Tax=Lecanosticta acicola TaxID=111012 RepID=A0AAI8Z5K7_9PEZI|nr:Hypothetical predicted protein [Lecanosticta acicola]